MCSETCSLLRNLRECRCRLYSQYVDVDYEALFVQRSVVHFVKRRACLYVVVQSLGAVAGAHILGALVRSNCAQKSLCTSQPSEGVSLGQVLGYEIIITFVLVLTVFAMYDSLRSGFGGSGPLAIGLSVSICHLFAVCTYYEFTIS